MKQKLTKIQKQAQSQQPSGSNTDNDKAITSTISMALKNADKLVAMLAAKMPKAKKEETLVGNDKVMYDNGSKRGKDTNANDHTTTKKTKEAQSELLADAKEDEEWTKASSEDEVRTAQQT